MGTESGKAGTESGEAGESNGKPIVVNVGLQTDPNAFGPWDPSNTGTATVYYEIYEFLFNYTDFGGDLSGVIAKSYEQLDELTYRVYLYDYVHDWAGNPITASDVKFSFEKLAELGNFNNRINTLENIEIIDDFTLDFHFSSVNLTTLSNAFTSAWIVSQAAYESMTPEEFNQNPIGTGPYKVESYVAGSTVTLAKNENYWQTEESAINRFSQANADKIIYHIITDSAQMDIALETGDIDLANTISSTSLSAFYDVEKGEAKPGYTVKSLLTNVSYLLHLNNSNQSPLQDENARLAVLYCLNNQEIVDIVLGGENYGEPEYTVGGSMYAGVTEQMIKDTETNCYSQNIDKAKEYLAEAGYGEGELNIRLMCLSDSQVQKTAQVIQSQCLLAGINVTIMPYDSALFGSYELDPTQWDIMISTKGNSAGTLPALWRNVLDITMQDVGNKNFSKDEKLQELLEKTMGVNGFTDDDTYAVHKYVADHGIMYGLYNVKTYYGATDKITEIWNACVSNVLPGACAYSTDFAK